MDHLLPLDMAPGSPLLPNSNSKPTTTTTTTKRSMLAFGILLVIIQLVCQQAQNEMFRYQETNTTFSVPVEGIYMNHTWLVWMFLGAWVLCCYKRTNTWRTSPFSSIVRFYTYATTKYTTTQLILRIIALEWIMFVPNVAWTMSVKRVSVTLSIATQQSQCVFVYIFSLMCLQYYRKKMNNKEDQDQNEDSNNNNNNNNNNDNNHENNDNQSLLLLLKKWSPPLAVLICLLGVVLVCFGESDSGGAGNGEASNYLLLAINPIFIAIFDLVFSSFSTVVCRDTEDVLCLMGCMGIATCTTCWPALYLDETAFQLPNPFSFDGTLLYGNSALATLFNFSFMVGLNIMGPLFISIGAVLQLPLSAVADLVLYKHSINVMVGLGGVCIMFGFLVLTVLGNHGEEEEEEEKNEEKYGALEQ